MSDFGSWIDHVGDLVAEFRHAQPFPHLVIDGFLREELAEALLSEFPSIDTMPRSRDYIFGNKHELSSVDSAGRSSSTFVAAVTSTRFTDAVSLLTGDKVFVDEAFHGGGFHQGSDGSFLDMHTDFNIHPSHEDWQRVVNCLLYLNKDWEPTFGGELLIKDRPDGTPRAISPRFNTAVIMLTDERTYHGYGRMSLPPGVTRKSIATYAYKTVTPGSIAAHTTNWRPESASIVKKLVSSQYGRAVKLKNRLFGSGTASNR
jgi:Rps23 Pro-64 3,4-dihydroxylase Tpa1-like proline 4-hydroxylase